MRLPIAIFVSRCETFSIPLFDIRNKLPVRIGLSGIRNQHSELRSLLRS
jgi:hypothetical protein